MTENIDVWATTAVAVSSLTKGTPAADAMLLRESILLMTQSAENAVLRPLQPGRWPPALRAALACRIARLNECPEIAAHYQLMVEASDYEPVADPESGAVPIDLEPCLAFMDRVATRPRDITADDIKIIQDAGVSDADIVRLCELNAFLAYQIRVVTGLSLLMEATQ